MPSEPTKSESKIISSKTCGAITALSKLLTIGANWDPRIKHNVPVPKTATEAAKYAELRFKAAQAILRLRFGTKSHGPMNAPIPDTGEEEMDRYARMSRSELKAFTDEQVASGELTEKEASAFRTMVREYSENQGATGEEAES